jgi:hypothetical protein
MPSGYTLVPSPLRKPPTKRFRIEDLPKHDLGPWPEGLRQLGADNRTFRPHRPKGQMIERDTICGNCPLAKARKTRKCGL